MQGIDEKSAESTAAAKTNLIWLIGGAFILLDVVLLSFYFLKRSKIKLPGKSVTQNASRKRKFRKNAIQPEKSPKSKRSPHTEAIVNPAFLSYLNTSIHILLTF